MRDFTNYLLCYRLVKRAIEFVLLEHNDSIPKNMLYDMVRQLVEDEVKVTEDVFEAVIQELEQLGFLELVNVRGLWVVRRRNVGNT